MEEEEPPKRRRVTQACENCRALKSKVRASQLVSIITRTIDLLTYLIISATESSQYAEDVKDMATNAGGEAVKEAQRLQTCNCPAISIMQLLPKMQRFVALSRVRMDCCAVCTTSFNRQINVQ